jgi:hypothetical protein
VVEPVSAEERRRAAGPRVPPHRAAPAEPADGDGGAEVEQEQCEQRRGGYERGGEHGARVPGAVGVARRRRGRVVARGRGRVAGGGEEEEQEEGEMRPHLDAAIQDGTKRDARTEGKERCQRRGHTHYSRNQIFARPRGQGILER